jgi:uncharacterized protein
LILIGSVSLVNAFVRDRSDAIGGTACDRDVDRRGRGRPRWDAGWISQGGATAMARIPTPTVDLDVLDSWLMSEDSPKDSMLLSDLDGFLTGIAVGPEPIPPSEWMSRVWGGEEPVFNSPDQASLILGSIVGRYSEIIAHLEAGPDSFDPLFEEGFMGQLIVTDWAAGFMDAVMLRPQAWEALIRDDEMAAVFWPVLLLGAEYSEHPAFGAPGVPEDAMDALYENAGTILAECVFRIRGFWREHAPQPTSKRTPRRRRPDSRRRR